MKRLRNSSGISDSTVTEIIEWIAGRLGKPAGVGEAAGTRAGENLARISDRVGGEPASADEEKAGREVGADGRVRIGRPGRIGDEDFRAGVGSGEIHADGVGAKPIRRRGVVVLRPYLPCSGVAVEVVPVDRAVPHDRGAGREKSPRVPLQIAGRTSARTGIDRADLGTSPDEGEIWIDGACSLVDPRGDEIGRASVKPHAHLTGPVGP